MSLTWLEGCELFNSTSSLADKGYTLANVGGTYSISLGRDAPKCLQMTSSFLNTGQGLTDNAAQLSIPIRASSTIFGFAWKYNYVSPPHRSIIFGLSNNNMPASQDSNAPTFALNLFHDVSNKKLGLLTNSAPRAIFLGDADALASISFAKNTWYYIEVKVVFGASGNVIVNVDGSQAISYSGSVSNTPNYACMVSWGNFASVTNFYDDFYMANTAGDINNDFIGSGYIYGIQPSSDVQAQWTRGGTENPAMNAVAVANNDPSSTAGFIAASTTGNIDLWDVHAASGIIFGLQTNYAASGAGSITPVIEISGTNYFGNENTVTDSLNVIGNIFDTNPARNNRWKNEDINDANWGVSYTAI